MFPNKIFHSGDLFLATPCVDKGAHSILPIRNLKLVTAEAFFKWAILGLFFVYLLSFQANITFFTTNIWGKMSIQYLVPGFELTTFKLWVSSFNHLTGTPGQLFFCTSFRLGSRFRSTAWRSTSRPCIRRSKGSAATFASPSSRHTSTWWDTKRG